VISAAAGVVYVVRTTPSKRLTNTLNGRSGQWMDLLRPVLIAVIVGFVVIVAAAVLHQWWVRRPASIRRRFMHSPGWHPRPKLNPNSAKGVKDQLDFLLPAVKHPTVAEASVPLGRDAKGKPAMGWLLNVVGKGQRSRQVPVPAQLLAEVEDELKRQGRAPMVSAQENQDVAILSRYDETTREPLAWSGSGLYKAIKRFADQAAAQLEDPDAGRMRRASTHWLRHSHGSHALQGREGHPAVPLQVVQNNLGHASVATTSLYLTTEQAERLAAMEGFWTGAD